MSEWQWRDVAPGMSRLMRDFMKWQYEEGVFVRTRFEVCEGCAGHGKRGNPAFDGMSSDVLMEWDDDEVNAFRRGVYDVVCEDCNGDRVIPVIDELNNPESVVADWIDYERSAYESASEQLQELRMGA